MKYLPLLFLLIGNMCIAQNVQKHYDFDHLLEYEYREEMDSPVKTIYYLTNSKMNNYYVSARNKKEIGDSLYVDFVDFNGKSTSFHLSQGDFFNEDFLLNCKIIYRLINRYNFQVKNYHFLQDRDTILNEQKYEVYVLKHEKEKREKRRKECRYHYIMEKNTEYHLASLIFHLANGEWRKEKSIPNGIPKLIYDSNSFQEDHHFYELKKISRINKHLKITGDCK